MVVDSSYKAALVKMIERQTTQSNETARAAQQTYIDSRNHLIGLGVLALVVSVVIGALITRGLLGQLGVEPERQPPGHRGRHDDDGNYRERAPRHRHHGEISAASAEQSAGIEQINMAVVQMDHVTQQRTRPRTCRALLACSRWRKRLLHVRGSPARRRSGCSPLHDRLGSGPSDLTPPLTTTIEMPFTQFHLRRQLRGQVQRT